MRAGGDPGRTAAKLHGLIARYQAAFTAIEKAVQPVVAAIHGGCIGGGVDMITACDIRYATADAYFQIKEVDIGLAADVGTLQRLPKVVGNQRFVMATGAGCIQRGCGPNRTANAMRRKDKVHLQVSFFAQMCSKHYILGFTA